MLPINTKKNTHTQQSELAEEHHALFTPVIFLTSTDKEKVPPNFLLTLKSLN